MNGLTFSEVILGILLPLVLASFAYTWVSAKGLWAGIEKLREQSKADLKEALDNDVQHLEERIKRLEEDR